MKYRLFIGTITNRHSINNISESILTYMNVNIALEYYSNVHVVLLGTLEHTALVQFTCIGKRLGRIVRCDL